MVPLAHPSSSGRSWGRHAIKRSVSHGLFGKANSKMKQQQAESPDAAVDAQPILQRYRYSLMQDSNTSQHPSACIVVRCLAASSVKDMLWHNASCRVQNCAN